MKNLPLYVFATILTIVVCLTVLVALGKIDPSYLTAIITGVIGYLIPAPRKADITGEGSK